MKEKMSSHLSSVIQPYDNARTDNKKVAKGNYSLKAIVFTQYRDTAQHIVDTLKSNGIKASRFVGQAKKEGDVGMKQEEQAQVLESFRRGEFSVLVATSIAEEGLDIPEVDLVIFYEPIPSERRDIQRRGRTGRRSSGSVIILAAKDTIDERYLNASKRRIEKMNQTLRTVNSILKPIERTTTSFISDPMTAEDISFIEANRTILETRIEKRQYKSSPEERYHHYPSSSPLSLTAEKVGPHHGPLLDIDQFYTTQFVRDVNNVQEKYIHY